MIIYPLPAIELDDTTLSKQIKAIAQVLCNVHIMLHRQRVELFKNDKSQPSPINFDLPPEKMLHGKPIDDEYTLWASTCRANYLALVDMGLPIIQECIYRWNEPMPESVNYKYPEAIWWARDNVPELPIKHVFNCKCEGQWICDECQYSEHTPFPLCVPAKRIIRKECEHSKGNADLSLNMHMFDIDITESYRNYYRAKLPKDAKWTRRDKPEYLK
jgi:hypothetical protein